ncbi:hypothetical protein GHT06_005020 [Daphnia sinensis]|uniref:Uncharacterized protein n=1 Tax=Daphnia sinensis TaxID=1820382 RepID=A0AAD5PKT4_9CRUS|nr:hypothetical protein GHT06_005020 [Daphnia sinensis]
MLLTPLCPYFIIHLAVNGSSQPIYEMCGLGKAAGSASWCTNVKNERGEIIISVLTTSESLTNLKPLPHSSVLYTENLLVRMNSWHFMRRIAKACSNESHPLYGLFMQKEGELKKAGVSKPSIAAVKKAITKFELARHCRRRTKGGQETIRLIESLFLNAEYLTNFLGTPLLKEDAFEIWEEEQCHVKCLQDPVNVMLYTQTGTISKVGTSANDVHFQAYNSCKIR